MRDEAEIKERAMKLTSFLEIGREVGITNRNMEQKFRREVRVLRWVLGDEEIKKIEGMYTSPLADRIIGYLRMYDEPKTSVQIASDLGLETHSISASLLSLKKAGKIIPLNKNANPHNPQKWIMNTKLGEKK